MKTLKKQIEDDFNRIVYGHQSAKSAHDIEQVQRAILKLAQAIDNINEFAKFE